MDVGLGLRRLFLLAAATGSGVVATDQSPATGVPGNLVLEWVGSFGRQGMGCAGRIGSGRLAVTTRGGGVVMR